MGLFSPRKQTQRTPVKKISASNPNLSTQATSSATKKSAVQTNNNDNNILIKKSDVELQKNINMEDENTKKMEINDGNDVEGQRLTQMGMDRYITIKRKRTNSSEVNGTSDARELKLLKNDKKDFVIKTKNRFEKLVESETSDNVNGPTVVRDEKTPPIYVREFLTKDIIDKIKSETENNFYVCPIKRGNIQETKIQINSVSGYRKVVDLLENQNKNYYTYQLKSAKGFSVVIKGIESSIDIKDLKEDLQEKGFKIKNIINIKNQNNVPQPMFKVELEPETAKIKGKHPIYDLRYVLYRKIVVEEPRKRKSLIQCFNCQEYGHTHNYCKLSEVCVICAGSHKTSLCPHDKNETNVKKCSNCGENHTANYRGCSIYIELRKRLIPKQRAEQRFLKKESKFEAKPESYVPSFVQPGQTYANVATPLDKKKDDIPASVEQMIYSLNSTMLKFMQMIESNMSVMLQCMNTLMQQNSK